MHKFCANNLPKLQMLQLLWDDVVESKMLSYFPLDGNGVYDRESVRAQVFRNAQPLTYKGIKTKGVSLHLAEFCNFVDFLFCF